MIIEIHLYKGEREKKEIFFDLCPCSQQYIGFPMKPMEATSLSLSL